MSKQPATLETVALEISRVLDPLKQLAVAGNAQTFLADIGIPVTPAQAGSLSAPLNTIVTRTERLGDLASELMTALDEENVAAIVSKIPEVISNVSEVIDAFPTLAAAIGGLGIPGVTPQVVLEIPQRVLNHLIVEYFDQMEGLNEVLEFFGVLERVEHNVDSTDPDNLPHTLATFHFNKIGDWLKSPAAELKSKFGWGDATFDGILLLRAIEKLISRIGFPVFFDDAVSPPLLDAVFLEITPKTDIDPRGIAIALKTQLSSGLKTFQQQDLKGEFKLDFQLPFDTQLIIQPNGNISFKPSEAADVIAGALGLKLIATRSTPPGPFIFLGQANGSRLEVTEIGLGANPRLIWDAAAAQANGSFSVEGTVRGGKVFIDASSGDGFLSTILSGKKVEANFDLTVGVSSQTGVYFSGSSTLEIQLPLHIGLGPIEIQSLTISVRIGPEFPINLGLDIKAGFGPLTAVVQNMGVTATVSFPPDNGNFGPLNIDLGFKPPNGVGLALDAGVIRGGGFLRVDSQRGQYDGTLELVFSDFLSLKAIGIITTKMPDGSKGFSLLIIITAEFGSGFQLGFGFTLLAVGGLIGLNRTIKLQALMDGVRTGAVESVMFPRDVIANAPKIISDLRAFFPPQQGRFLIGPMAKIGWGTPTLISISLGIIIEIPGNIVILGVLKVVMPTADAPLIVLQVNFVGALEFDRKRFYLFAALFESRIVFVTIEGEMGVLVAFGEEANFVISVGGFHPRFNPPPLPFPSPRRISVSLLNTSVSRIYIEGYFAITSNTAQFGARAEVFFGTGSLNVQGHLAFDALFQFSPFYFVFEISASLSVKVFGVGLFSVKVRGTLDGPGPYHIKGHGSISLLFWSIGVDFKATWGESRNTELPAIAVMPMFVAEMNKAESWRALLPATSKLMVTLRKMGEAESAVMLHPLGVLSVSQRAVPLGIKLDKVGTQKPSDVNRLSVEVVGGGLTKKEDAFEEFAAGQFQEFSDGEKLSLAAFAAERSGVKLSAGGGEIRSSQMVKRVVRYEEIIIDSNFKRFQRRFSGFFGRLFEFFLGGNSASRSELSQSKKREMEPFVEKIEMEEETYTVAYQSSNRAYAADSVKFKSEASAREYLKGKVAGDGRLEEEIHVIPSYERAA
jgi:hypothetical protein